MVIFNSAAISSVDNPMAALMCFLNSGENPNSVWLAVFTSIDRTRSLENVSPVKASEVLAAKMPYAFPRRQMAAS